MRLKGKVALVTGAGGGLGTAIISTSQGLMTGVQARKNNIGGELLCYIW